MTSPYENKESLASSSTWHQAGQGSSSSRQPSSTQQPIHAAVSGSSSSHSELEFNVALFDAQKQNRMMAWQQQQQLISPGTAVPSQFDFGTVSSSVAIPDSRKMASSSSSQHHQSQQSTIPPLYSIPSPSLALAAFAPIPLQYPQQSTQSLYYPVHQQQQDHHQQQSYGSAPSNYSNYPSHPLYQIPLQSGAAPPFPFSLPSSWMEPFPSEAAGFYHGQNNPPLAPAQISPLISPNQRSRPQMMERQSPFTSSPPKSGGNGSGGAVAPTTIQTPSDEGGVRWAVPASQKGGAGVTVYPSGLVQHRGSYSTMSSEGSTSRSSSMSIPMSSHHFSSTPHPNLTSYFDPSLGTITMPPPNPPSEIRLLIEQGTQKRAATACNFCRARKLRCDGNAPCRQCARRDIECIFSQSNPSKRKRKQDDDDNDDDDDHNSATRKDSSFDDFKSSTILNQGRRKSSTSHELGSSTVKRRSGQQNQANLRTFLLSITANQQNRDNMAPLQEDVNWCRPLHPCTQQAAWKPV